MEIRKTLVVSTVHLSEQTARGLDMLPSELWLLPGGTYDDAGYFLFAPDEGKGMAFPDETPADLMAVCRFARAQGCDHVLLDRDAEPVDGLATFEW